jgi:hypothetical protein
VKGSGLSHSGLCLGPLTAGWVSHFLGLGLSGGKVHHQDLLPLECGLVSWWRGWLDRGSGLLVDELASPW